MSPMTGTFVRPLVTSSCQQPTDREGVTAADEHVGIEWFECR
jgi:hypothetical protein